MESNDKAARPVTLTQYLRVLQHQWLVVALLAILGLGGAAAYTYRQTPVYSAHTQLFVSVRTDTGISGLSQGNTFTQQRVKSYADIVTSPLIAEPVINQLRLPFTPEQLTSKITASSPLDTVLLDIIVSDTDPIRAAAIANAVGAEFPRLVGRLETPSGQSSSPVTVSVTRAATVPSVPVSPRIPLNLALGLIVGLGLGIGAAVLRDQFNTSVSGIGDVEKLTGAIPLGVVPYDALAGKQPLITADQFGGRAEAFRTLRTNLQFADVDEPPRVITITSALPAEGKTTTACNIALTLAQSGARVVLVEGDLRKPAVGKYLGISNAAGLTNVLAGQHELRDVIVSYQRDTLAVLPSGPTPPNPSEMLGSQQMHQLLTTLATDYDLVIIDAPPLLPVTDAAVLASASDGAIMVVRHGKSRREEVERAIQALTAVNAKVLGTVLNFAPRRKRRGGYDGYGYGYGYGGTAAPEAVPSASDRSGSSKKSRRQRKQKPVTGSVATTPTGAPAAQTAALLGHPDGFPAQPGAFQPGTFPGQSGDFPAQPGAFPGRPGAFPAQSDAFPGQPGAFPARSGAFPAQPDAFPAHPGGLPAQSDAFPAQPGAFPAQPGAFPAQPGAFPAQPSAFPARPSAAPGRPSASPGRPSASPGQSGAYSGRPGSFPAQPGAASAAPSGFPLSSPALPPLERPATQFSALDDRSAMDATVERQAIRIPKGPPVRMDLGDLADEPTEDADGMRQGVPRHHRTNRSS
jgi:capsular exopolysaccharide synthesis family protein